MNSLVVQPTISAMTPEAIDKVRQLEEVALKQPQCDVKITHTIHSGVYTRTVMIPAGVLVTGAYVTIPTTLIISGDVIVFIGDETVELSGYNVITAAAGRKQACIAKTDTHFTMLFATDCQTVEEAEMEFTNEFEKLSTRSVKSIGG